MPDSTPHDRLTCLDFDLEIGPRPGGGSTLSPSSARPLARRVRTMSFPFDELQAAA